MAHYTQIPVGSTFWAIQFRHQSMSTYLLEQAYCFADQAEAERELYGALSRGSKEVEFRLSKFHKDESWPPTFIEVTAS